MIYIIYVILLQIITPIYVTSSSEKGRVCGVGGVELKALQRLTCVVGGRVATQLMLKVLKQSPLGVFWSPQPRPRQ